MTISLLKKLSICNFLLLAACIIAACGSEKEEPTPEPTKIETQTFVLPVKSEKCDIPITISPSENWKVLSEVDWIQISPAQGTRSNGQKITVNVAENTTQEARSGKATIVSITNPKNIHVSITINQNAGEVIVPPEEEKDPHAEMKLTATEIVKNINVGWNLGNTCECGAWTGYTGNIDVEGETLWGNPKTTQAMIDALQAAGFNAVRIPVRWYAHADKDLNIREAWMNRVKEIVNYAYDKGMYVILNSHHDNWYDRLPVDYDETDIKTKFENMWKQIATAFNSYDEHLIFAGINEIIKLNKDGSEDWGEPTTANWKFANALLQLFVNTVRATGGNNELRCLMVQPWAASPRNALNIKFKIPKDSAEKRLIVEYHCYDPYNYAIGKDNAVNNQWAQHEVKESDLNEISTLFDKLNTTFVENGIPCIMAEFGSTQDNSYSKGNDAADQIRADYHKFIVSEAKKYNIPGFYWDNGNFNGKATATQNCENFGLLDRKTCTFPARAQVALQGIMDGIK